MKKAFTIVIALTLLFLICSCYSNVGAPKITKTPEEAFADKYDIAVFSAKSLFSVCEQVGISVDGIYDLEAKDNKSGLREYTLHYENSLVKAYLKVSDGTYCMLSVDDELLFNSGEAIKNFYDVVLSDEQILYLKSHAEEFVYERLKAPSTAQFGPLDYSKYDSKNHISGYVDAQNSFGAMLRTYFVLSYVWPHDSRTPTLVDYEFQKN